MLVQQVFSLSSKNSLCLYLSYIKVVAVQIVKWPVFTFLKCLCKSGNGRSSFFKKCFYLLG